MLSDLPPLDPALLIDADDLAAAVEAHIAALTTPDPEITGIIEVLAEVLGDEHAEQLRHVFAMIANRNIEITASLVRTAITDTEEQVGTTRPVEPIDADQSTLDESVLAHEVLLGWAIDQLLRRDPRHRRQSRRILRLQRALRRIVSAGGWRAYLKVERAVNNRMGNDETVIISWAFRQGAIWGRR